MPSDPYIALGVERNVSDLKVRHVVEAFEILSDSVFRAASEQAERHAPQSANAPKSSDAKRRYPEHEFARDMLSRWMSYSRPSKRAKEDCALGMSSSPSPAAAQAKAGKSSGLTEPTHATPTGVPADSAKESHGWKARFVARLVQGLLKKFPHETLMQVEEFLRDGGCVDDNGGDFPHKGFGVNSGAMPDTNAAGRVNAEGGMASCVIREEAQDEEQEENGELDQAGESEGTFSDIKFSSESTSAFLIKWMEEEEEAANGASCSEIEFAPYGDDCSQEPQMPAMEVTEPIGGAAFSSAVGAAVMTGAHATGDHGTASTGCVEVAWATAAGPPSPRSVLSRVQQTRSGSYMARIFIHSVTFLSNCCHDLNKAINIQFLFVHMRQVILAKMQDGFDFPDALQEVDALITAEQSKLDFRISYDVRYWEMESGKRVRRSIVSSNVDQAIALWKDKVHERLRKRLERKQ
eukprot:TRINITY_DN7067_c0_g3_i1.p1 TRINITY_DN7067_c0_g3~~TRINITY_DN7067_c0_g3_i1.p1  ORF type:complete len:464 (-),score=91.08 TRINITY_DN7067_c0_g3_i1:480-1871(-)